MNEASAQTQAKTPFRTRALQAFVSGPAALGVVDQVDAFKPYAGFVERLVLGYRRASEAIWAQVEVWLNLSLPFDKDLASVALLLALPLARRGMLAALGRRSKGLGGGLIAANLVCVAAVLAAFAQLRLLATALGWALLAAGIGVGALYLTSTRFDRLMHWAFPSLARDKMGVQGAAIGLVILAAPMLMLPLALAFGGGDLDWNAPLRLLIGALLLAYAAVRDPAPSLVVIWAAGLFAFDAAQKAAPAIDAWLTGAGV